MAANVERLKTYRSRVILFPRNSKKPTKNDASAEDVKAAKEAGHGAHAKHANVALPVSNKVEIKEGKVADYKSEGSVYRKLRDSRSEARLVGVRAKRAAEKAEEKEAAKK